MPVRVAINGFGRVGRCFFRAAQEQGADVEVVAINDLAAPTMLAQLLKYDSVYGRFPGEVIVENGGISVAGQQVSALAETDPSALPWSDLGVDVVIESTGLFRTRAAAAQHLEAGAHKVIISAPAKGDEPVDATVVLGVNFDQAYDAERHHVISNASCTTKLPCSRGEGTARDSRDQARPDDNRSLLHVGPEPARRPAHGPASCARLPRST